MSRSKHQRKRQLWRLFHVAVALILIICIITPYLELALDFNDSIFATGYDTETTLAVLALLLELVISLCGILTYLFLNIGLFGRIVEKVWHDVFESTLLAESLAPSSPPPLRI